MMNKKMKDVIVVGFALFAMFFGAGNLIFPPSLGQKAGVHLVSAILGFLITGVGLPLLAMIAIARFGGNLEGLASKANGKFAKLLTIVVILALGPLLAIPRTSATTFEMSVLPFFPRANPIIFSAVYFAIVLFFILKSSSLIDNIGKILTPLLLFTLITIIVRGVLNPQGSLVETGMGMSFAAGFSEGYQTMDALGATVLGSIVVGAIRGKGYKESKEISRLTIQAGIVAALGLTIVYGGLAYLGATAGDLSMELSRPQLIIGITGNLMGEFGKVLLGVAVGLACLTTSIGLTATTGEYFSSLSKGRISYKLVSIVTVILSMIISNAGVDRITSFAVPLLVIVYPIIIVLVGLALLDPYIQSPKSYSGAVFATLVISVLDSLSTLNINIPVIQRTLSFLPLAHQGFGWLLPAVGMSTTLAVVSKYIRKEDRAW